MLWATGFVLPTSQDNRARNLQTTSFVGQDFGELSRVAVLVVPTSLASSQCGNRPKAMSGRTSASSVESLSSSSKGRRVPAMRDCPARGGEPLWHAPGHPANFISTLNTAKTRVNGGSRD
jgi:hypothetical protein